MSQMKKNFQAKVFRKNFCLEKKMYHEKWHVMKNEK